MTTAPHRVVGLLLVAALVYADVYQFGRGIEPLVKTAKPVEQKVWIETP